MVHGAKRCLTVLTILASISFVYGTETIQTHFGHNLPLNIVRSHAPDVPDSVLHTAIYEHVPNSNRLISHHHVIEISDLAPQLFRVSIDKPVKIYIGNDRVSNLEVGPYIRRGNGYTFIFKEDQITLITAWGPNFSLSRVGCSTGSRIFVNSAVSAVIRNPYVDPIHNKFRTVHSDYKHGLKLGSFRLPESYKKSISGSDMRELQLYIVSDRSLTHKFCGNFSESNAAIAAMIENVKPLFMKVGIELRIEAIRGATLSEGDNDLFALPSTIKRCRVFNGTFCSETVALLDSFRKVQLFKDRKRDATVVVTGYGLNSGAVGAAYIAAACNRKWGWAWMQYSNSNENVLSHELAHLLGALHDKSGIMTPTVGSNELSFSSTSKAMIMSFVKKVSSSWCLRKTSREDDVGIRLFRAPPLFSDTQSYVHDVTFTSVTKSDKVGLAMLFTHGPYESSSLYVSTLSSIHKKSNNQYSIGKWSFFLQVPNSTTIVGGGGGIAFGNIISSISQDIIVAYIDSPKSMKYRICFNTIDERFLSCQNWSTDFIIPVESNFSIKTVGITVADIRKTGNNDLIVAYVVDHNSALYQIGWDLSFSGLPQGGWSKPRKIKHSFSYKVCGLSVATCDAEQNGQLDLVVYSTEVSYSERMKFVRIGRNIGESGAIIGGWTQPIPAPKPLTRNEARGGIGTTVLPGDTHPTTVIVNNMRTDDSISWSTYIDLSFNITEAARAEANGTLFESIAQVRSDGCLDCYKGGMKKICVDRLKSCDDDDSPIETTETITRSLYNLPSVKESSVNKSKIFCVGFDALFINVDGDTCEVASSREHVIAKGVVLLIAEILTNKTHPDETIEVENYEIEPALNKSDETSLNYPGEWAPKGRPSNLVVIWLRPKRRSRKQIIIAALIRIQRSTDFSSSFKDVQVSSVRSLSGNKFLVRLHFADNYWNQPTTHIPPRSPYAI